MCTKLQPLLSSCIAKSLIATVVSFYASIDRNEQAAAAVIALSTWGVVMRWNIALLLILLSSCSRLRPAQVSPSAENNELRSFMAQLRGASEKHDATLYAASFANDASWEGPSGESALGRRNIENAMRLVFQSVGSLQFDECDIRILSPTLALLELHQTAPLRSGANVATASGSIQVKGNLRTTLLLRRNGEHWQIVFARLAYLGGHIDRANEL